MPNPTEVCTVIIGGQQYSSWKTVAVNNSYSHGGATAEVSILEVDLGSPSGATQQISVGQRCQVLLGGVLAVDGWIQTREAAYTPQMHGLMIKVVSNTILAAKSSVQTSPGQFKNQTISQIANSILSPLGIAFKYGASGAPSMAEKVFERVSLNVGETIYEAVARLAWMRNLFLIGDVQGNIVATRANGSEATVAQLVEGGNIKSANAVLSNSLVLENYAGTGQNSSNDQRNGRPAAAVSATATSFGEPRTYKNVHMPQVGDPQDAQMVVNREAAQDVYDSVEIMIVVPGWFGPAGELWIQDLGQKISINSPMLFPASFDQSKTPLYLKGVTHRQNDATGTETELNICIAQGLGGDPPATSADFNGTTSVPQAPD